MRSSVFLNHCLSLLSRPKTVYSPARRDRLRLHYKARGIGLDFHSLVWERRKSFLWQPHVTLTQSDFALPNKHPRWVADVHSLDSSQGVAILKMGEGDAPDNAPVMRATYSWRKWDLVKNKEIARLQDCANPFDPFIAVSDHAA
jgi:hypothetical protein